MKRIILLAALAVSFNIQAETLEAHNSAGGKIVLTDKRATCPDSELAAYSTTPGGSVVVGCWSTLDERIVVKYESGRFRIYEPDLFELKSKSGRPARRVDQ